MIRNVVRNYWRIALFVCMFGALWALIISDTKLVSVATTSWLLISFWVLFVPREDVPANLEVESLKIPDDRGFDDKNLEVESLEIPDDRGFDDKK